MEASQVRTLKHWTVSVKPLRKGREGYLSYYQYLINKSGKHRNNTIQEFTRKRNAFLTIRNSDAFNLARQLTTGGRPSNYGWSAIFSYPFPIEPKKMRQVFEINMRQFFRYVSDFNRLQFSDEEIENLIKNETVAVMHSGFKPNGEPINNHLHVIIPKHFKSPKGKGLVSINLTHKRYLKALLLFNNASVDEVMGLRIFNYEIKSKDKQKKRKTASQYSFDHVTKQVDEAQIILDEINAHILSYKEWANEAESHDEEVPKELNRALKQVRNGNTDRARKTLDGFKIKFRDPNS